jgi:hypothetical protein
VRTLDRRPSAVRDEGAAVIEFIVIAVALLIPVGYAALAVAHLQSAAFATSVAAREAGRAFATAPTVPAARSAAGAAARVAFADHGLELPDGALWVRCDGGACLAPGSAVITEVSWRVPLPWVGGTGVDVTSRHVEPIDDFRSEQR